MALTKLTNPSAINATKGLTTTELINSSTSYQVGDTVTTTGFATAGDGGGDSWQLTATTGTVNQSPAQLGGGLLNDGLGKQWKMTSSGAFLKKYGCVTGLSDSTLAMQAAFNDMVNFKKTVYIDGSYTITTINIPDNWVNINVVNLWPSVAYESTQGHTITTSSVSAFNIPLENGNHYRCSFDGVKVIDLGASRTTTAFNFEINGLRAFNYPIKWYFDDCSVFGCENVFRFKRTGGVLDPDGFFGTTIINRLSTFNITRTVLIDGTYANLFYMRDCRLHSQVEHIKVSTGGGGFFDHIDVHFEDINGDNSGGVINLQSNFLQSKFSFHNFDWEGCGNLITIASDATSAPTLIFTGKNRFESFATATQIMPHVRLFNYGDSVMPIIPARAIIYTPETVSIIDSGDALGGFSHYFVPVSAANNTVRYPIAMPLAGQRAGGASQSGGYKDSNFEYIRAYGNFAYDTDQIIPRTHNVTANSNFICSFVIDLTKNLTRISNPVSYNINGAKSSFQLPFQGDNGRYVCVMQFEVGSLYDISNLNVDPVSPGDYFSIGYGFWVERGGVNALDLCPPKGYKILASLEIANTVTDGIDFRGGNGQEVHATAKAKLSGGAAMGQWMANGLAITAGDKSIVEIANLPSGTNSISGGVGTNFELMRVAATNNTGATQVLDVEFEVL